MISHTAASNASGLSLDLPPHELETEADQTAEVVASQQINARRALEEKIEILRFGRAL
jgi:hypothetical protein